MYVHPETVGFKGHNLSELARLISDLTGLAFRRRDNSYWGEYFRFATSSGEDHLLVPNEAPTSEIGLAEAAEEDFLEWNCIFWTDRDSESEALTQALLSIEGATLLRPATSKQNDDAEGGEDAQRSPDGP